ncbi:MAG: alpha/beta hydrolase, partial [Planctomycetota bacterium]
GGGWTGGAPGQFSDHAAYFPSRGIVCFQVEYRLLDKKSSKAPDTCIEDATDAMRWVQKNAEQFGVDTKRVASGGGSAGGHLAAFLGCNLAKDDPAKPAAMLLFNPVYDNGPGGWGTKRVGDAYKKYSPAHNITADDPPSIVFLGSKDKLIPVATAEKFQKDCEAKGVQSKLEIYEGQGHGFFNSSKSDGLYYRKTVIAADRFLQSLGWLTGNATLEE